MRSYSTTYPKSYLSGIAAGIILGAVCLLPAASHAQETQGTPPPLQSAETPPPPRVQPKATPEPEPEPVAAPAPVPTRPPRVHAPKPSPTPSSDEPVAVVNGVSVYRSLFPSAVADPVDRALVLQEYHRRGYVMPASALDEAVKTHTKTAFGDPAKLTSKLAEQGASNDDYRNFVAEEVKLQAMLGIVTKSGRTDADRKQLRAAWIAGLRKNASINKPKKA